MSHVKGGDRRSVKEAWRLTSLYVIVWHPLALRGPLKWHYVILDKKFNLIIVTFIIIMR